MDGKEYLALNKRNARKYPILKKKGYADFLLVNDTKIDEYKVFQINNRHLFSGYYDIDSISPDGTKMFSICISKNAVPGKNKALIKVIDLASNRIDDVVWTNAWNWQQGSRIRWVDNCRILYNDYSCDRYKSILYNVETKCIEKEYLSAFYDVRLNKKIGISLNFDLLQKLRPGYGYSNKDYKIDNDVPINDGLYLYDFKKDENVLLISFNDLTKNMHLENGKKHYLNHISISPDGDKFMFFHLWTRDSLDMWKMRLIVSDLFGKFTVIESDEIISHYTWVNNNELLVTLIRNKNEKCYCIYNVNTLDKRIIENDGLVRDGHPTFVNNSCFITDTYPLENSIQHLLICNLGNKKCEELLSAFSDPRMYIEKRCDMHPRLHGNYISIDSTYSEGVRKIILLRLFDGVKEENNDNL